MIEKISDDESSRWHEERLQQKVTTAAQTFLAKNAHPEDRNQLNRSEAGSRWLHVLLVFDDLAINERVDYGRIFDAMVVRTGE